MRPGTLAILAILWSATASAQSGPPRRAIPPSVLSELAVLESRFEAALAADCPQECFSRGCTYVAHAVADQPQSSSLPGLVQDPGPGSVEPQAWLTRAQCSFAHEPTLEADAVQALARRLQTRVTHGWTVVNVGHQALEALPEPEETAEEPPALPPPPPPPWTAATAARELWLALLDHFYWMIAVVLVTLAGTALIWAWRRVGRETLEERALLAQLTEEAADPPDAPEASDPTPADGSAQIAAWRLRLAEMDPERPDPEIQGMLRELLLARELPLLAKAVLTFPDTLPAAFPTGGDVATAKLALAEFLKRVDPDSLPGEAELFRTLERHALAAALASQRDAEIVRSLRESFGAAGLVGLIQRVPARAGALLFALAPAEAQHEVVRLLPSGRSLALAEQLLQSNRMNPAETAYLFAVLEAARADAPLPEAPTLDVSDHGAPFDATAAISLLLSSAPPDARATVLSQALSRFGGSLPAWYRGLLVPEMLLSVPEEARADLLLGVEVEGLAAWLSLQDGELARRLLQSAPNALRSSVRASSAFPSRERQLELAEQGRQDLVRALQGQLARLQVPFEQLIRDLAAADA